MFILIFGLCRSTDRSTDVCFSLVRSTGQSTEVLADARIRVHVCRSTGQSTESMSGLVGRPSQSTVAQAVHVSVCMFLRSTARSTDCKSLCSRLELGRPGGRPLPCNGHNFECAVDRQIR